MKKLTFLFLIVIMLFAFVSCSPEASSGATDSNLLPGEVTPPSESERVAATDEEITKAQSILELGYNYKETESYEKLRVELDFADDGKITITGEANSTDYKAAVNGQIKTGGVVYKADNLVLKGNLSNTEIKIESGRILKGGTEMTATEAKDFISNCVDGGVSDDPKCTGYDGKGYSSSKRELFGSDGTKIGTGTLTRDMIVTKDGYLTISVFDYTVDSGRVQAKMRESNESTTFDYIAFDGKFFDEESVTKFLRHFNLHY